MWRGSNLRRNQVISANCHIAHCRSPTLKWSTAMFGVSVDVYCVNPPLESRFYPVITRLSTQLRYNRNSITRVLKL